MNEIEITEQTVFPKSELEAMKGEELMQEKQKGK